MGFFDKKVCDICGEKIGLLGNRKVDDGNVCKNCAKKLSPWFTERRHSTLDDIREQLAYREQNKQAVQSFQITNQVVTCTYSVLVDTIHGNFAVARKFGVEENPDIIPLSQLLGCNLDVSQHRKEETYLNKDRKQVSYNPPRYMMEYDYKLVISVESPWFDTIEINLNGLPISERNRMEIMNVEQTGNQIINMLNQARNGAGMMNGNGMMNQGMMNGNGMLNHGSMNGNGNMNQSQMNGSGMTSGNGMTNPGTAGTWRCSCGAENTGKFCEYCGQKRP